MVDNKAGAAEAVAVLEFRRFERRGEFKAVKVGCVAIERYLRNALIRFDDVGIVNLERLIFSDSNAAVPIGIGPGKVVILRKHSFGRLSDVARKIRNVIVVRHAVVIHIKSKLFVLIMRFNAHAVAAVACFTVVRHVVEVDLPLKVVILESCLVAEHDTALCHIARCERVVVVGREIEVVGNRQIHAARRAHAVSWRQKARTAFVADRKREPWRAEDRHAHEVQARASARSGLIIFIDLKFIELDVPGFIIAFARRNRYIFKGRVIARKKLDVLGAASDIARCIFVLGVLHLP